jgi:hypothetical protein
MTTPQSAEKLSVKDLRMKLEADEKNWETELERPPRLIVMDTISYLKALEAALSEHEKALADLIGRISTIRDAIQTIPYPDSFTKEICSQLTKLIDEARAQRPGEGTQR